MATASGRRRSAAATDDLVSRAEYMYHTIRELIREGELHPGQRIIEVDIASRFGVSRTPVRDALQRLISEGLVSVGARRGLVVTELEPQQILELYALREVLEGFAARLAARHSSDSEIQTLRQLVRREAAQEDPADLALTNRLFHQAIYSAARNRYLLASLNGLRDSLALLRSTTFSAPGRPATALEEHTRIVDAIERRDGTAAEELARGHIRAAERLRVEMFFGEGAREPRPGPAPLPS